MARAKSFRPWRCKVSAARLQQRAVVLAIDERLIAVPGLFLSAGDENARCGVTVGAPVPSSVSLTTHKINNRIPGNGRSMHPTSLAHMKRLAATHLSLASPGTVIDVGSLDINGSYREIFASRGWRYFGCDAAPGKNVDVLLSDPYALPFEDGSIDLVVSGQALEHIEYIWQTMAEIARILRPGGMVFLIAPSRGPEHRFPVDCWRFYPDGFRALARWARLDVVHVQTDWPDRRWWRRYWKGNLWGDTVGVFRKPEQTQNAEDGSVRRAANAVAADKARRETPISEDRS